MMSPGAICRRAVRDRLADPVAGWNALIRAIAEEHGAPSALGLDFGATGNVESALRDPDDIDTHPSLSNLILSIGVQRIEERPGSQTFVTFAGIVEVVLQFLYRHEAGEDYQFDALVESTEFAADAIEECALRVLNAPGAIYPGITPLRAFACERGPAEPLQDGIRKPILIQLQFEVTL